MTQSRWSQLGREVKPTVISMSKRRLRGRKRVGKVRKGTREASVVQSDCHPICNVLWCFCSSRAGTLSFTTDMFLHLFNFLYFSPEQKSEDRSKKGRPEEMRTRKSLSRLWLNSGMLHARILCLNILIGPHQLWMLRQGSKYMELHTLKRRR